MNYLESFKTFYFRAVLPNTPSYQSYFGSSNFDKQIAKLIEVYRDSFGNNPFEVSNINQDISFLKTNLTQAGTVFSKYSDNTGSGVPKAILNNHFLKFLEYNAKQISFRNLQVLIDCINADVNKKKKNEDFIRKFREFRKNATGQSRVVKAALLFGDVRDNSWTINLGAEKELQYHIHINEDVNSIRYGLGFNMQASGNNREPIEYVKPFKEAFYAYRYNIDDVLKDYKFWYDDEENLKNLTYGSFSLYGQEIPFEENADNYNVQGLDYLKMLYDLKHKQFKIYRLLFENSKKTLSELLNFTIMNNHIKLLHYKKQIILQGPPGTGKTKLAKELAQELISENTGITTVDILKYIEKGIIVESTGGKRSYYIEDVDVSSEKIDVKRESGTRDKTSFADIKQAFQNKLWEQKIEQNSPRRAASLAKYIFDKKSKIGNSDQFKIVQFHPSYTYEDFVRGIVAKPNPDGDGVIYEAENKTLGRFAKEALKNYLDSKKDKTEVTKEHLLDDHFKLFVEHIMDLLEENDYRYPLTDNVCILNTDEDAFRYKGGTGWSEKGNRMLFKDIKQAYLDGNTVRQDLKKNENLSGLAFHHASYFVRVLNMFQDYLKKNNLSLNVSDPEEIAEKKYVLIIDEINRANLSSVLGELIYALEYRDDTVESIYKADDSHKLTIPPNLYIIGTMNTADRSVGHIDYAIRRRFAFVDVLPQDLSADLGPDFDEPLFRKISKLFIVNYDEYYTSGDLPRRAETLSQEFRAEDVWIGHSYFIDKKNEGGDIATRLQYEIKPILMEYVKDGILIGKVKAGNEEVAIEDYVKSL